jgi:hypothetical protein
LSDTAVALKYIPLCRESEGHGHRRVHGNAQPAYPRDPKCPHWKWVWQLPAAASSAVYPPVDSAVGGGDRSFSQQGERRAEPDLSSEYPPPPPPPPRALRLGVRRRHLFSNPRPRAAGTTADRRYRHHQRPFRCCCCTASVFGILHSLVARLADLPVSKRMSPHSTQNQRSAPIRPSFCLLPPRKRRALRLPLVHYRGNPRTSSTSFCPPSAFCTTLLFWHSLPRGSDSRGRSKSDK